MKTILSIIVMIVLIITNNNLHAQTNTFPSTGAVGIGTTTPDASSLLEIKSTKKGVLIPRMTIAQRNAIASPATGLLIYQTNSTPGFYYYTGNAWTAMTRQPGWSLTGNAGTTPANYLGTSDKKNLVFKTNNIQRAVIDSTGNMGIGTTKPTSKLEVHNGALTVSSTTSASLIINANASAIGNSNQILFADNGVNKWTLGGSNIGSAGTNNFSLYNYNLGSNVLTILKDNNNVGIGTASPLNKLHISTGSAGVSPYGAAGVVVESASHTYINLLAPDAYETGILFGKPQTNLSGGIIYNNSSTQNGFQFRTGGNVIQMVLTSDGHVGIGTTDPGPYQLKISGTRGLDIEETTHNYDWELQADPNNESLSLYSNNNFMGAFSAADGSYSSISDERLKTNIQPMGSMLGKIKQLKPSTYQFKNITDKQEYNGFIAQDVLKIFPSLVAHNVNAERKLDVYTLNYSGFGVIAIKGIQELSPVIQEQKEKITTLEERINKLEEEIASITANEQENISAVITQVTLEQNKPNPFAHNTTIGYILPPKFATAQIIITDKNGKAIKTVNVSGSGKGSVKIDASILASGAYQYSLYVDGKLIETKQMLIAR